MTASLGLYQSGSGLAGADLERGIGGQGLQLVAADDLDQLGDSPGAGMLVEGLAPGDGERVGAHGLDPDLVGAGLHGLLDVGCDPLFQFGEELVLLVDRQRQQAVQETRHRRQVFLEVAFVDQLEAGGVLETVERPARDVAAPEGDVETPERRLGVEALQVVALAEERLAVAAHGGLGIALAAGDGAEAVEPPGNGGDEPPLALHIGGDGPEQRRRGLVRAVGAPEALDRLVGAPSRLQQIVDPALGIGAGKIGVIAAPGAPGHREHQDAFPGIHEGGGLGEVGGGRPRAQRQALAARIGNSQHPARPAGHFRDGLVPEMLHDLVERRRHRRERGELLDQRVAAGDRLLAQHRIAVTVEHRPREQVAALVGERLLELYREGVGQELDDGLARGEVDGEVVPLRSRDLGDAPFHQRLAGRDQLDDR